MLKYSFQIFHGTKQNTKSLVTEKGNLWIDKPTENTQDQWKNVMNVRIAFKNLKYVICVTNADPDQWTKGHYTHDYSDENQDLILK